MSLFIKEVKCEKALNLTSIDIAQYVINPYKGCEMSCIYCYVRNNKNIYNNDRKWGDFVDVKIDYDQKLENELKLRKVKKVLIGSTTECFQSIEKKYNIMRKILRVLNNNNVHFTILTRSPLITDYISDLKLCDEVYFSMNWFDSRLKTLLEPKSPSFNSRIEAVKYLIQNKINVIPYICPIIPHLTDYSSLIDKIYKVLDNKVSSLQFEFLNFNLKNFDDILNKINNFDSKMARFIRNMQDDEQIFESTWEKIENEIKNNLKISGKEIKIFKHPYKTYFQNKYKDVK